MAEGQPQAYTAYGFETPSVNNPLNILAIPGAEGTAILEAGGDCRSGRLPPMLPGPLPLPPASPLRRSAPRPGKNASSWRPTANELLAPAAAFSAAAQNLTPLGVAL